MPAVPAVDADFRICSAGRRRRSISVKSLPNGNAGRRPVVHGRLQRPLDRVGRVVARGIRQLERRLDLAGVLGLPQQIILEALVGDGQHRDDDVAVAFAAKVGDAVFGHDHIAQMARDRGVTVAPPDVGLGLALRRAACAQHDHRTRAFERESLRDEIVLSADAADDPAILKAVGNDVAQRRRHHGVVDEARIDAGAPFGVFAAVELVDVGDRGHAELVGNVAGHVAQRAIERARAEEKPGMQHRAIDLALEDAGAVKVEQALDEHFGAAVKAGLERRGVTHRAGRSAAAAVGRAGRGNPMACGGARSALARRHRRASRCRSAGCRHPAPCWRRAAPRHNPRARRARVAARTGQSPSPDCRARRSNSSAGDGRVVSHERQFGIDLAREQEVHPALPAQRQQIEREVGVAAQAERMGRLVAAMRHKLRDDVDAAIEHGASAWV